MSSVLRTALRSRLKLPHKCHSLVSGGTRAVPYVHILKKDGPASHASFHSTRRNQGLPIVPLVALLKTSTALELVRTAGRIGLTMVPLILAGNRRSRMHVIRGTTRHGVPISTENKRAVLDRIKHRTLLLKVLLLVPFVLFWGTIVASLERTPLTGRWRLIILSPEEEADIAAQLAGSGWYAAVDQILTEEQGGPPRYLPTTDWRYIWVRDTLRRLEASIPILAHEPELCPEWYKTDPEHERPLPPPAQFPLRPRPRASEYLRCFCDTLTESWQRSVGVTTPPMPPTQGKSQMYSPMQQSKHSIPGPPYSLLVVDNPTAANAFSYGFGPDGGGGIVVYTGFLDDIFARITPVTNRPDAQQSPGWIRSWLSWLVGYPSRPTPANPPSTQITKPTPEQTAELAILLAHELSHLILSHHLETLSSATVIVPGVLSIISDVVRVALFPITMLFGPFVNDAVAQMGKIGSGELGRVGEYCTSVKQEVEADVVSARVLAHAGFDARRAVRFWEERDKQWDQAKQDEVSEGIKKGAKTECASVGAKIGSGLREDALARRIVGSTHPVNEVRIVSLRQELMKWEEARLKALENDRVGMESNST